MTHGLRISTVLAFVLVLASCSKKDTTSDDKARPDGRAKGAEMMAKKLAYEAYPTWAAAHPDASCPATIQELAAAIEDTNLKDPWGTELKMFCGANLPAGAHGLAVLSAGPDHAFDTPDDIKSW